MRRLMAKQWLPLWQTCAFIAVILAVAFALHREQETANNHIVASQLNGCVRGNALRDQVNYDTNLLRGFMLQIVKAVKQRPGAAAAKQARLYQSYADRLLQVKPPVCQKVIFRP